MNNIFNPDFLELLACFNKHEVDYILIGGYSVVLHGYPRTTGDLDLWVRRDKENYNQIAVAFSCFQLPLFDMTLERFLDVDQFDVFRYGRPPVAVDIITKIKGVEFALAKSRMLKATFDGVNVNYISQQDLKATKIATGRPKDINDLENLGF